MKQRLSSRSRDVDFMARAQTGGAHIVTSVSYVAPCIASNITHANVSSILFTVKG